MSRALFGALLALIAVCTIVVVGGYYGWGS
jgi:hypothetical protein